jgi:hypothetical protein
VAIGPVILISGIGLLLLSMTNRFARTIDRSRQLAREFRTGAPDDQERAVGQVEILMKRAHIIRGAIASASLSVLLAALLIIALFIGALFLLDITAPLAGGLFVGCMASLIVSLILFIIDINLSLRALKLEIGAIAATARRP